MLDESYRDGCNSVTITTPSYPAYPYNPYSPFYCGPTSTESDSTSNVATVAVANNEN